MPTAKPRISVTLSEEQAGVLQRLSRAQGRPVSAIVHDLLEQATPLLDDVAATLEALEAAGEAARARLASGAASDLENAQTALQPHLRGILDHFRDIASIAEGGSQGGVEASREGTQRRAASPSQPPYNNMGVRPSRKRGSRSAGSAPVRGSNG